MLNEPRVLDASPVADLAAYRASGGGEGLETARRMHGHELIELIRASGLRGRGGAGFPTGVKWLSIAQRQSELVSTAVVVNAAEGEPFTYKDRAIIAANPYRVIEGALIAAHAVGARRLVIGTKQAATDTITRLRAALTEMVADGWVGNLRAEVVAGPSHYLLGEETGLLEAINGRPPFPRISPPYRRGVGALSGTTSATATMATEETSLDGAPALVNNVETLANVPAIVARGPGWFRAVGTNETPGTVTVTVSGRTRRHGVGEVPAGTPLREALDLVGGGPVGEHYVAALCGVSHPILPVSIFDTPLCFDAMDAAIGGLGAAGYYVLDDTDDVVAAAAGVAHFLAVESCGQCTPCKQDGLTIAALLERVVREGAPDSNVAQILADRSASVVTEARCYLAQQQQNVVDSLLRLFPGPLRAHAAAEIEHREPMFVAPIASIVDGTVVLEEEQDSKQPDWTHGDEWSGEVPAERLPSR